MESLSFRMNKFRKSKKGPERVCELLELLCGIKIDKEGGRLPNQDCFF